MAAILTKATPKRWQGYCGKLSSLARQLWKNESAGEGTVERQKRWQECRGKPYAFQGTYGKPNKLARELWNTANVGERELCRDLWPTILRLAKLVTRSKGKLCWSVYFFGNTIMLTTFWYEHRAFDRLLAVTYRDRRCNEMAARCHCRCKQVTLQKLGASLEEAGCETPLGQWACYIDTP